MVRTKQNISYFEAKKIVNSRTPTVGTSYAAATAQILNETQTEQQKLKLIPHQKKSQNNKNLQKI